MVSGCAPPARLAALLALCLASALEAQEPPDTAALRVAAVRLAGVHALAPRVVREAIVTQESRCRSPLLAPVCAVTDARWAEETAFLDPAEVERDEERIRSLYGAWGYPEARVASQVVPRDARSVNVWFTVLEGEPLVVRSVEVRGLEAVPAEVQLPSPLPLRPGEPYAPLRLEATQRLIGAQLAELGYAFAQVVAEEQRPAERLVDLVLEVRPGPVAVFGRTVILPGPPISAAVVERRLAYREGERFRPSALDHTAERLYRLPVVERVFIDPRPTPGLDTVLVTTIGATPGRVQGLQLGGSFSSIACLEGMVGWSHRYLFGAPRVLTLSGGASNLLARPLRDFPCTGVGEEEFAEPDYLVQADLREPIGLDTWLLLGGGLSRESSPQAFIRRGVQGRLGVVHTFTRELEGSLLYSPERRDLLAAGPIFCGVHGVCSAAEITALTADAVLAPLELSLSWTPPLARRPPTAPAPGPAWMHPLLPLWLFTARAAATGAGSFTGSEFSFGRAVLEGTAAAGRGRRAEAAARLRIGALAGADAPLPPHLRLFGGGPLGVRGVAPNRLGPRILTATPGEVEALGCTAVAGGCEGVLVDPRRVRVRPTGGDRLIEVSLEGRYWITGSVQLAAFLDYGALRSGAAPLAPAALAPAEAIWTPGIGAFAITPLGPLRVDLAYNPSPVRRYPLLMRTDEPGEQLFLGNVIYDPFGFDDPSWARRVWRRLQFQLSTGLPF